MKAPTGREKEIPRKMEQPSSSPHYFLEGFSGGLYGVLKMAKLHRFGFAGPSKDEKQTQRRLQRGGDIILSRKEGREPLSRDRRETRLTAGGSPRDDIGTVGRQRCRQMGGLVASSMGLVALAQATGLCLIRVREAERRKGEAFILQWLNSGWVEEEEKEEPGKDYTNIEKKTHFTSRACAQRRSPIPWPSKPVAILHPPENKHPCFF